MAMSSPLGRWQYGAIQRPRMVIVGAGEFAEIAYEYFKHDSPYEVVGFAVERAYLTRNELCGLPVVLFEEVESRFPPRDHSAFVAITYTELNRVRARLFAMTKAKGYDLGRYVSSESFVWHTAQIGENVFIFENNIIQHGTVISDDCVLWSGNHVGHRSKILSHCYIASHVVISGYCVRMMIRRRLDGIKGMQASLARLVARAANEATMVEVRIPSCQSSGNI